MAIDLRKESYSDKRDGTEAPVRTVYPENDSEEIYPQREIYPQKNNSYDTSAAQEEIYPDPKPQPKIYAETREDALPQPQPEARKLPDTPGTYMPPAKAKRHKKKKKHRFLKTVIFIILMITAMGAVQEYCIDNNIGFMPFATGDYSERTVDISAAGIKKLVITDSNSKVTVVPSTDKDFHVTVRENVQNTYDISSGNGVAEISGSKTVTLFSLNMDGSEVTVAVPEDYAGKISVDSSNSRVECSAGTDIEIKNSNGRVELSDIAKGGAVTVKNSNARIKAENVIAEELSLTNSNGRINGEDLSVSGRTVLSAENSKVDVNDSSFGSSGSISSDNGSVHIKDCFLGNDMTVSSDNGSVHMYDFSFEDLLVKARNGSIDASAYGEEDNYTIKAAAKNGSSNIESGGTGKYILELDSNNGSIHFDFDGGRPIAAD